MAANPQPESHKLLTAQAVIRVAGRGIGVRALSFVATLILARILTPSQFGTIAIGTSIVTFGGLLINGGLGAGLIRRRQDPTAEELASVLGSQLVVALAVCSVGLVIASISGSRIAQVTAVMSLSLVFMTPRTPRLIQLERDLNYGPLLWGDLAGSVGYAVWAIGLAVSGAGVWSLATAVPFRELGNTLVFYGRLGHRPPKPSLRLVSLKPLLRFGVQFQANSLVGLVRDEGLNFLILGLTSTQVLGYWSLVSNVMQVPFVLFDSLWRVSYPAMARLQRDNYDVRHLIEKVLRSAEVVSGVLLSGLVAGSRVGIPLLFGRKWIPTADAIPPAALGLAIGGSISVAVAGFLYAQGKARPVLLSAILHTVVWFLLAAALLRWIGVSAVGIGWMGSALVEGVFLAATTRRIVKVSFSYTVARYLWPALCGGAGGFVLSYQFRGFSGLAVSVLLAEVATVGLTVLFNRRAWADVWDLIALVGRSRSRQPEPEIA